MSTTHVGSLAVLRTSISHRTIREVAKTFTILNSVIVSSGLLCSHAFLSSVIEP